MKEHEIIPIMRVLVDHDLDFVCEDDNGQKVVGPDGELGWFNDVTSSYAVQKFDTVTVRTVVEFLWLLKRIIR